MTNEEIIQYYDYLIRLATSKCNSQNDAEDLVGDTMLAAFAYLNKSGTIEYPKTWLTNTLYHKLNDKLRKKYRAPITVCLDESVDIAEAQNYFFSKIVNNIEELIQNMTCSADRELVTMLFEIGENLNINMDYYKQLFNKALVRSK